MRPVVLAVAITGSVPRKTDNPAVPITVAEQVESTHEAFEAGASLVHIHVRNPDETPSSDPQLFKGVMEGVRRHCPGMIVQFSTGGRGRGAERARQCAVSATRNGVAIHWFSEFPHDRLRKPAVADRRTCDDHETVQYPAGNRGL